MRGARALVDLLLPAECGGCKTPGSLWCARCAAVLRGLSAHDRVGSTFVWGRFAEPLSTAVTAWKDEGRRDLRRVLADPMVEVLARASPSVATRDGTLVRSDVIVVPVPTSSRSRRLRGDWPLTDLTRLAVATASLGRLPRLHHAEALALGRAVRDQSGLGREERLRNLEGAIIVRPAWEVAVSALPCIVVDDVLTTGATIEAAMAALRLAGSPAVVGAVLAGSGL